MSGVDASHVAVLSTYYLDEESGSRKDSQEEAESQEQGMGRALSRVQKISRCIVGRESQGRNNTNQSPSPFFLISLSQSF